MIALTLMDVAGWTVMFVGFAVAAAMIMVVGVAIGAWVQKVWRR